MSTIYNVGPTWKGFSSIKRLVIFGASYCSVEYVLSHDETKPNAADPLGLPFPGDEEYGLSNEPDQPNWVGYLLTKFRPGPRYTPNKEPHKEGNLEDLSKEWIENPLLVHDYAKSGDTLEKVALQINKLYVPGLGQNPPKASWTAEDALFVTWVGINDCATGVRDDAMKVYVDLQDQVYKTGARNFVFIDVPPIHRSPAFPEDEGEDAGEVYKTWNTNLCNAAKEFSATHPDSSVFLFSSFQLFNTLLDDLTILGLKETDLRRSGGPFWFDHIHPTSKVHELIAGSLASFLSGIQSKNETS